MSKLLSIGVLHQAKNNRSGGGIDWYMDIPDIYRRGGIQMDSNSDDFMSPSNISLVLGGTTPNSDIWLVVENVGRRDFQYIGGAWSLDLLENEVFFIVENYFYGTYPSGRISQTILTVDGVEVANYNVDMSRW